MERPDHSLGWRPHRPTGLSLLFCLALACADGSPRPQDPLAALASCPRGDAPWLAALKDSEARKDYAPLTALARELSVQCAPRWESDWILGEVALAGGDSPGAEQAFARARQRATELRDPLGLAWASYRLAGRALAADRIDDAFREYETAHHEARAAGHADLLLYTENGLAGIHVKRGEWSQAIALLDAVAAALNARGQAAQSRRVAINRALVSIELGDALAADRLLTRVHTEAVAAADPRIAASAATELATLSAMSGDFVAAERWLAAIPEGDAGRRRAQLQLADWRLVRSQTREAGALLKAIAPEQLTARERTQYDLLSAQLALLRGDTAATTRAARAVREVSTSNGWRESLWQADWLLGRAALARAAPREAVDHLRQAVAAAEEQSGGLDSTGTGLRFLLRRSDPFVDLAAASILIGDPTGAFAVVERAHGRALRQELAASAAAASSLAAVQRSLNAEELLLDFALGQQRGVVIAVSRQQVTGAVLPGLSELAPDLARYRALLTAPLRSAEARDQRALSADGRRLGQSLARRLIEPLGLPVDRFSRLYLVPDRELALLPWEALPWGGGFLGERLEIAVMPLAGPIPRLTAATSGVLLAGDPLPDDSGHHPPLAYAAAELDGIAALYPARDIERLERGSLSVARLSAALANRHDTIHLATHAEASTSDPSRCAVILSRGEQLGLAELAALRFDGCHVVLSACRTGEGEVIPGEGVVGLGWALLRAGAGSLVLSLWSVEDRSTAELMIAMHRERRAGADPVTALARARRELMRRHPHPAFWAPFVSVLRPGT